MQPLFEQRWRQVVSIDWDQLYWRPACAGIEVDGRLLNGPQLPLPKILTRIVDPALSAKERQRAVTAGVLNACLDDVTYNPGGLVLSSALRLAPILVGLLDSPDQLDVAVSAADTIEFMARSKRPWWDPGEPRPEPLNQDNYPSPDYAERRALWRVLDRDAEVFLSLLAHEYPLMRRRAVKLVAHFPRLHGRATTALEGFLQDECDNWVRSYAVQSLASIAWTQQQPIPTMEVDAKTDALVSALCTFPLLSPTHRTSLVALRKQEPFNFHYDNLSWRAHCLLSAADKAQNG